MCSENVDFEVDPQTGYAYEYHPEDKFYWPAPSKRTEPSWSVDLRLVDTDLHNLVTDIYVALNNDLGTLAAIGMRTALDRASGLLGVQETLTFAQKLTNLNEIGKIGLREKERLSILIDAGHAAAHRGWRPSLEELDTMMSVLETFLSNNFVLDARSLALRQTVPVKDNNRQNPGYKAQKV